MAGAQVVLTVAEGKRLIARGLMAWEPFRRARESGTVAVAKGTTNSYLVEELMKDLGAGPVDRTQYVTGNTRPAKGGSSARVSAALPDLVLTKGEVVEGRSAAEAVADMGPDDIFLKGANAIQYSLGHARQGRPSLKRSLTFGQAAVLIGHPTGGTMGAALGTVISRKVRLVVPAGLEKHVPVDLADAAAAVREAGASPPAGGSPALWVIPGELFTEVEALEVLSGAMAVPIAAGGIGGAEGSIRLLVTGEDDEVRAAVEAVEAAHGEPAFLG